MYEYQMDHRYFSQIAEGLEDLGMQELSTLGAAEVEPAYRGIYFKADKETLYRINYCARLSSRILAPLVSFACRTDEQLYRKALEIKWPDFISEGKTFAVFAHTSKSGITNSHYASLRLKDGIVDSFREMHGKRPDVDPKDPDIWLHLHIRENKAVISIDTSGGSLHKRGYRKYTVEAPMQETVAAAIIKFTEWNGEVPIYDPMCGSGTLLIEALMHYCRIPSGFFRVRFGFQYLPDYDDDLWQNVKEDVDGQIRELPEGLIAGSDLSAEAVKASAGNIQNLPQGDRIKVEIADFRDIKEISGVIVTNPPYGIRMGGGKELDLLFRDLGDFLKRKCKGSTAYIYFGERELIKKIGLKPAWKKPLKTGGLDGRLVKYDLF